MKLLRTVDKVLAAFGNIRAMERTHVDTYTEELISEIEGYKIAESEYGQLFVSFQSIANYEFLNITILSGTNIKTFKGCKLIFVQKEKETLFFSDTQEIASDYSNVSNRWLTKISFIIDENDKNLILTKEFDDVFLSYKKKSLPMRKCT